MMKKLNEKEINFHAGILFFNKWIFFPRLQKNLKKMPNSKKSNEFIDKNEFQRRKYSRKSQCYFIENLWYIYIIFISCSTCLV